MYHTFRTKTFVSLERFECFQRLHVKSNDLSLPYDVGCFTVWGVAQIGVA